MNDIEKAIEQLKHDKENFEELLKENKPSMIRERVENIIKAHSLAISALEKQLNGGWIPVSVRLPEEKGFYIFQLKDNRMHEYYYVNKTLYGDCEGQFDEPIDEVAFSFNDVIAWQPLPEPYKEVQQ